MENYGVSNGKLYGPDWHPGSAGKTQHMLIGILHDGASGNHLCSFPPFCHGFLVFTLNFHYMDYIDNVSTSQVQFACVHVFL